MLLLGALQNGGRKIQTVGTSWQGTPLMGELANIAGILGFGCGKVADLSTDVASRWLSKIPSGKQMEVYYYTTENVSTWQNIAVCRNVAKATWTLIHGYICKDLWNGCIKKYTYFKA